MRRTLRFGRLARTLAVLIPLPLASSAFAADRTWSDPAGGSWQDAANWSGSLLPAANDRAIFDLDDTGYTVNFSNSVLDVGLLIGNDRVTLDLFGAAGNLTFTQSDVHPFIVGEVAGDDGRLTVTRSGSFNTSAATARIIGSALNSSGRLVLTNNAVWVATNNNAQEINVGLDGNGVVILQDGARGNSVGTFHLGRNATASGSFTVTGPASSFSIQTLRVGTGGAGAVLVDNGASLSVAGATMALTAGASGSLTVNGPGSDFSIGSFNIANAGPASVTVSNAARLTSSAGVTVGANLGGNGSLLVTGLGSRMAVAQALNLGDSVTGPASASLTVSAGGALTSASSTLSRSAGSTAHALVTGPGSSWNLVTDLTVGLAGDASLTIADGAAVSTATTTFAQSAGSTARGRVTGPGSALRAADGLTVGGTGSASVSIDAGALVSTATVGIAVSPLSRSSLDVSGPGTLLTSTGGIVVAANGIGSMTVSDGARVTTEDAVTVASGSQSTATVRVSGPATLFEASTQSLDGLTIGASGKATLIVEQGAAVRAPGIFTATGGLPGRTAAVTVSGPGSSLSATDSLGGIGIGGNISGNTIMFGGPTTFTVSDRASLSSAAHLVLGSTSTLSITSGATASVGTKLTVFSLLLIDDATLSVGTLGFDNQGETRLAGNLARITNPTGSQALVNTGLVSGNGRIDPRLDNKPAGEVRVSSGQRLHFAFPLTHFNEGELNLLGGTLEFSALLANTASGRISGRGTLVAPTLDNEGRIHLSSGLSDFFTTLNNTTPASEVIVSGGASATFYSPVNNVPGSEFRVSQNSTATFFAHVTGSNFFSGPGTVNFEAGASIVGALSVGNARVAPLASLDTTGFRTSSLTVEGTMRVLPNSALSRTASLTILDNGSLDLASNDLVIDAGDLAATTAHFTTGRLFSSATTPITTLAIVKNNDGSGNAVHAAFSGEPVDPSDVLIKYTYSGDANLDGRVTLSDFFAADRGRALRLTGWQNGDFNHSGGAPDASDFLLLDRAFLAQGAPLSFTLPPHYSLTPSAASSPVPEPAVALLLLPLTLLPRRRRPT